MGSLDEPLLGRNLEVHAELDARGLLLVSARTVGAARGPALLDLHGEYGEEYDEQRDHEREQRPQDEMIDELARLRLQLLIELVAVDGVAVATQRVTRVIAEARRLCW